MITKNIKNQLTEYFLQNPTKQLRLRQIERETNISFPLVSRYTKELVQENILKATKITNIIAYSANRGSRTYQIEKKLYNLRQILESGLCEHLIEELSNPKIILFGSYAKGDDVEESDIDLYIETVGDKKINLEKFEEKLNKNIHIFKKKAITDIKNPHLQNNIVNGIPLNGTITVFNDE